MRRTLDGFYQTCGVLACVFMAGIAVLVLMSAAGRWFSLGWQGLAEYSGYCMAASSFLGLAYTFRNGGHIRVTVIIQFFNDQWRRGAEIFCLGAGSFLATYLAWYSVRLVYFSWAINDVSQGADATPLWIPQLGMAVGAVALAVAMIERLVDVLQGAEVERDSTEGPAHHE